MIKDNQKTLNILNFITDALLVALSYFLSYQLRFNSFLINFKTFSIEQRKFYEFIKYADYLWYLVPSYMVLYYLYNLYTPKRGKYNPVNFFAIVKANTLGIAVFTFLLYFNKESNFARLFLFIFYIVNISFMTLSRYIQVRILKYMRSNNLNLKHIVLVGYSRSAEKYINRILSNPQWGYYIHGILDDSLEIGYMYRDIPVIGNISNLTSTLANNDFDEVAITLSIKEYSNLQEIVRICEKSGTHTKFIPDYNTFIPTKPYTEDLNGLPVINIRHVPLNNYFNAIIKRFVDIIGSLFAIIIFLIPMIIIAIIIKSTSKGPIFFSQVRVGKGNKDFKMYKFRSMEVQSESKEKKAWTTSNDPRVTKIGKFIRKTSIDELPQLFNVLKGDMSLVGPRPERPFFVEKFKEEIPRYMIKHQVRPGITGWAQVSGYRGDTSIYRRIEYDLYYIEHWTMSFDFKILFLTIFKGFINENAY